MGVPKSGRRTMAKGAERTFGRETCVECIAPAVKRFAAQGSRAFTHARTDLARYRALRFAISSRESARLCIHAYVRAWNVSKVFLRFPIDWAPVGQLVSLTAER